jgi:glycosyltransferase involved in cell wall biosynthesis
MLTSNFPLVSVICLNYNHSDFVIECLNSIKNQTYSSIEIIIVDDFSTDNSVEVVNNWLKTNQVIAFLQNEENIGNTKSFNKALKLAKGDYIIDLAADDVLNSNCIALQIDKFQKSSYKNLGIVYGNAELIDEKGNHISYYFDVDTNLKLKEARESGNEYLRIISGGKDAMCTVSSMIKKELYDKLNGYDETLAYEDLDFWVRASREYNFDFIDNPIIKKRVLCNSLGSDFYRKKSPKSKKINSSTYKIIKKILHLNSSKEEDKAVLKRIHFEMILNFKNSYYKLIFKYLFIELKLRLRILFNTRF